MTPTPFNLVKWGLVIVALGLAVMARPVHAAVTAQIRGQRIACGKAPGSARASNEAALSPDGPTGAAMPPEE